MQSPPAPLTPTISGGSTTDPSSLASLSLSSPIATPTPTRTSIASPPGISPLPPNTTTTTNNNNNNGSGHGTGFPYPREYHFPPFFTLQTNLATRRSQFLKWSALVLSYCAHHRLFRLSLSSPAAEALFANPALGRRLALREVREVVEFMRRDGRAEWYYAAASGGGGSGGGLRSGWSAAAGAAGSAVKEYYREYRDGVSSPVPGEGGGGGGGSSSGGDGGGGSGGLRGIGSGAFGAAGEYDADLTTTTSSSGGDKGGGEVVWIYWKTPEEWAEQIEAWVDATAQRNTVLTLYELTEGEGTRGKEFHGLDPELLQKALNVLVKRGKAQIFGQEDQQGVKIF